MTGQITHNVYVRELWKHPCPTNEELKLLLDLLEDGHPYKVVLSLIAFSGVRPIEACGLRWHNFRKDSSGRFVEFTHRIYKATNNMNKASITTIFKAIRKPILSDFLQNQLQLWESKGIRNINDKLFSFGKPDSVQKWLNLQRKIAKAGGLGDEYEFLTDPSLVPLTHNCMNRHRITMYSLRRFCLTFLFWTVYHRKAKYNRDGAALLMSREYSGHSRPSTLLDHYILPPESIGLTQDMVESKIGFDQFVRMRGKNQKSLFDYAPIPESSLLSVPDVGQASLE